MGSRRTDDIDEGILHAALPGTRRSNPPRAARTLRLGRCRRSPSFWRDGEKHCRRGLLAVPLDWRKDILITQISLTKARAPLWCHYESHLEKGSRAIASSP